MFRPFTLYKRAKELSDEISRIHKTPEGDAVLHRTPGADGAIGMAATQLRTLQTTLNTFFANDPLVTVRKDPS